MVEISVGLRTCRFWCRGVSRAKDAKRTKEKPVSFAAFVDFARPLIRFIRSKQGMAARQVAAVTRKSAAI